MALPVSSYEELLLRVRSITHETIQLRRELTSSLTDPQPDSSSGAHSEIFGYATHPQRRLSIEPVRKTNELSVDDLDLGGLRISGDSRPTRPTTLFPKTKQHEADDELKEVDERRSTPEHHRGEWGQESLGLWHSGPSSLGFTHATNNNMETSSVMSFSSSICAGTVNAPAPRRTYSQQQLGTKVEMVYNLLSMLGTNDREDMSKTLLAMSSTAESCLAMRQSGCLPLLIQLIHATDLDKAVRARAAEALHNIVHAQTDDKRRRREARVLKLLETVREHCDLLKAEGAEVSSDKHPGAAVAALMKFSFDAEHRQAMCTLGGLHAIADLIMAEHLAHDVRTEASPCVTMKRYAGMALTNLTFGDGANKALLCSMTKFIGCLVLQLLSPSEDLRQVTASVIRNLSWRADSASKATLQKKCAVKVLMSAAQDATKEATLKSILSALWNLSAHCSVNKADICAVPGALAFLVRTLRYKPSSNTLGIIENAGGILRNVSSHVAVREDYRQILRDAGCFEVLLEQLKSPSLTVVSNACGTLWNLSARCAEDQRRLWDMGATSMLRSLVQSKHKMIAMGSSAALKNLLAANPNGNMMAHLDSTARGLGLQNLPSLSARKQRALEQELDATLAAAVGTIDSEERVSCRRSDSKESVTSTQSDSVYERVARGAGKVLENKDVTLHDSLSETGGSSRRNDEAKLLRRFRSSGIPTPVSRKQPSDEPQKATPKRGIPVFKSRLMKPRIEIRSSSPRLGSGTLSCPGELEEETNECPVNYSLQYREESETVEKEAKPLPPVPISNDLYAETDLDQPTDFSLKYGEEESSDEENMAAQRYGYYDNNKQNEAEDTIRTYYTEGTPYDGTPYNFSSANSMLDLRLDPIDSDPKVAVGEKEKESPKRVEPIRIVAESGVATPEKMGLREMGSGVSTPERPVQYCEEGTPGGCFSRVSSLSSLSGKDSNKTSPGKKEKDSKKLVTFTVDQTPLMFSRSSSLASLNSLAPPLPDQDGGSSVVSTFSRMTSGAISPSELPDSPTQSIPPSAPPSIITTDQPMVPPMADSVFDDCIERYKLEGTPIEFSRQTSLSCLTCEQTGSSGSSVSGEEGKVKVGDVEDSALAEPGQDRLELSSVSECDEDTDEHILADCISIGMPDTSSRPGIRLKPVTKPITKPRCGIPAKATTRHVYEDSVQTYHTEGTPASISHAGSNSDLSIPQPEDGSCNSSDTESILNECIHSGMPQGKPGKPTGGSSMGLGLGKRVGAVQSVPANDFQVEVKRKDLACGRDELSTFATENSPCTFSTRSSLSDLTINTSDSLGPPHPRNSLMISPALNSTSQGASPSSISLIDSEDGVKGVADEKRDGWDDKLSRPNTSASSDAGGQPISTSEDLVTALSRSLSVESFDSCEPTPQEQALLEQCIHSGMPHRPKNVNAVSVAAVARTITAADASAADGRGRNCEPAMATSGTAQTWSDDVMVASAGGHTWSDDVSVTSLGSVGSNEQDGLRVLDGPPRPVFRVGDTVTPASGVASEAVRVSRELRRLQDAELLASVTSELSLASVDSFLDAELIGLELPDRPTPDFLASEEHPVTLKLLKLKNGPLSAPSLGPAAHNIDFDLEGSMISVASITSEIAESATLAEGSDTEIPEDDFSSHSQESLPRDDNSPKRITRKLTPKEKRRLTQDRYRTYTVEELKEKCEQERVTPKQKRLNDKERFLTRTISVEERTGGSVDKYSTYRVQKDPPLTIGKPGLSAAERLQVVANATLVANTLTSEVPTYDEMLEPALTELRDLSINTDTFVAMPSVNGNENCEEIAVEPDEMTVCEENGLSDCNDDDDEGDAEDDDAKGPRITVPSATVVEESPKAVRGRRKPLYSSPRRFQPSPLVREGTFTKDEGSGKGSGSRLPEPKSASRPAGIPRPATSVNKTGLRAAPQKRPTSVGPHQSSQPSASLAMKRHSASSVPTMKNSSSNHSIKSTGSGKSVAPPSPDKSDKTRQGPGRPRTPKKEVTSKIASLWKKVEETKKSKSKTVKDSRVWITPKPDQAPVENGDAEEVLVIEQEEVVELASGKIVRSSTFQGDAGKSKPQDKRVKTVRNSGDFSAWSGSKAEPRQSAIVPPFNYNPPSSKPADLKQPQTAYPKKVTTV